MLGWLGAALAVAAAGCGRVGFDARDDATAAADVLGDTASACAASPGLVAYWPFDEGTGTVVSDLSKFGQTGDLTGGVSWVAGRLGTALHFDGVNGTMSLRSTVGFDLGGGTGSFTLSYWLSPTSESNRVDIRPFELAYCTGSAYLVAFIDSTGVAAFSGYDASGHYAVSPSAAGALPLGTWTHVAHVLDRTSLVAQTYINGVASGGPDDISAWTDKIDCSAVQQTASIGGWGTFYYDGGIDDVRFYARALSASEITALAHLSASGCP